MIPSWMRSSSERPCPWYFFAIETTRRRFEFTIRSFAALSPRSIFFASSTSSSAVRACVDGLEGSLGAGEEVGFEVPLSLLAGREVTLEKGDLRGARRRAVQLLATGGDPRRELDPDGRAVSALAADLDSPKRRAA